MRVRIGECHFIVAIERESEDGFYYWSLQPEDDSLFDTDVEHRLEGMPEPSFDTACDRLETVLKMMGAIPAPRERPKVNSVFVPTLPAEAFTVAATA